MPQFGQPPLAAQLPLKAGQNLADLPDKAVARTNLGTLSSSEIMMNSVPIGTIISFWGSTAPVGYLPCNGQTINSGTFPDLVTFLGGTTSAVLPDLRGEFLRGWDNGRGVDLGRALKDLQLDAFQGHDHSSGWFTANNGSTQRPDYAPGTPAAVPNGRVVENSSGNYTPRYEQRTGPIIQDSSNGVPRTSTETRPRNVSVQYCMKAYGALVNTATANMGNVLTELSQTLKNVQFDANLGTSGYQKLPSGMILQWMETASIPANTSSTVTFPIVFPNNCLFAMACARASAPSSSGSGIQPGATTNSGITVHSWGTIAALAKIFAIGY